MQQDGWGVSMLLGNDMHAVAVDRLPLVEGTVLTTFNGFAGLGCAASTRVHTLPKCTVPRDSSSGFTKSLSPIDTPPAPPHGAVLG